MRIPTTQPHVDPEIATAALAIALHEDRINVLRRDIQLAERVVHALRTYREDQRK